MYQSITFGKYDANRLFQLIAFSRRFFQCRSKYEAVCSIHFYFPFGKRLLDVGI